MFYNIYYSHCGFLLFIDCTGENHGNIAIEKPTTWVRMPSNAGNRRVRGPRVLRLRHRRIRHNDGQRRWYKGEGKEK